ncbi:Hypothetical predicted protein [Podarcis lilfordi]|uniref:Uncharacterized protein n=1 Tax=Podarcis lilfordi TaxID=74358 RepID=A0AA35LMA8_9SAUR|nr:Hypothetical predicted protein [Podarcis lilfordi]
MCIFLSSYGCKRMDSAKEIGRKEVKTISFSDKMSHQCKQPCAPPPCCVKGTTVKCGTASCGTTKCATDVCTAPCQTACSDGVKAPATKCADPCTKCADPCTKCVDPCTKCASPCQSVCGGVKAAAPCQGTVCVTPCQGSDLRACLRITVPGSDLHPCLHSALPLRMWQARFGAPDLLRKSLQHGLCGASPGPTLLLFDLLQADVLLMRCA